MTTEYSEELRDVFSQIGVRLKTAREAMGMSLQDISARTRINQSFLGLIEAGDLDNLPSLAFVKGFIRNTMQVLELRDEEVEEGLQRLNFLDSKEASQTIQQPNPNLLDTDPDGFPIFKVGLGIGIVILILVVGFFLIRGPEDEQGIKETATVEESGKEEMSAASETPQTSMQDKEFAKATPPDDQSSNTGQSTQTPPATGAVASTAVDGRQKLELTIRGLERTWVRLSLDRAPPIDVLIEPAETVGWEAQQEFLLTIGKSHGVAIYLNGEEFLIPKDKNQLVRDLVLNKLTLLRLEN